VFDLVASKPGDAKEGVLLTLGVPASDADRGSNSWRYKVEYA
jgi:hypothetical protein